jgi:putative peptide zinc metalloprotease protein
MNQEVVLSPGYALEKLTVNPDVSLISNNQEYMIYINSLKKYFQLGESAIRLFEILKENPFTKEQLIYQFCNKYNLDQDRVQNNLGTFIESMIEKGFIISENKQSLYLTMLTDKNEVYKKKDRPILKIGTSKINTLTSFIKTSPLKEIKNSTFFLLGGISITLLIFIIYSMVNFKPDSYLLLNVNYPIFLYMAPWILLHLLLHEFTHAYVCKKVGGELREVGVGLLYYLLPVAYVDLTDTYRLPRKSRALISLSGPVFDLIALSISATIVITQDNFIQLIAYYVLGMQSFIFFMNCNLFFPSDLYRTLENFSKDTNLRKHSFEFLRSILSNKERPIYLKRLSPKKEIFYITYSVGSSLYIAAFLITIILFYIKQLGKLL